MSELHLIENVHPTREMMEKYDGIVGIDSLKAPLVDELILILDPVRLDTWQRKHHPDGLGIVRRARSKAPLVLLSGDVGCGKTALASCVATPVAKAIDRRIVCLETPSDIRGRGHVGELSSRITESFTQGIAKAKSIGRGLLIIDEADDLVTSRSQMQAHHEDRAGVNVLIKQIDQLSFVPNPMVIILITNRADVLDPAVMRRVALQLHFARPGDETRAAIFRQILEGTKATEAQICELVALTKCSVPYTSSDLTDRIARLALRRAWKVNEPFGPGALKSCISEIAPTPLMQMTHQVSSDADL